MSSDASTLVRVPHPSDLVAEIAALDAVSRADAVAAIKAIRVRELARIGQWQLDHLSEATGLDVALQVAGVADVIIRALARRAFVKANAPADWQQQVGLFAVGGYGRGEQNPHSDIDLLVLAADSKALPWLAPANAELQALMWDVKFVVGASMRNLGELERITDEDFVTATAVLEQRPLMAGEPLIEGMRTLLARFRKRRTTPFLKFKLDELAKRRAQAGVSLFQMEPNLKSNPGCLRDVQLLRNMAFLAFGSRNLARLTELDVITDKDLTEVSDTNDYLLGVRAMLHFHHGRKQDVFQLADQVRVAKQSGYADVSQLRAVEHFMKRHYAQVLHVHQTLELAVSRLRALGHLGRWTLLIKTRKTIDKDFTAVQGQVYLAHADFWKLPDAPARLIRMCRNAQSRGYRLSLELQLTIRANLELIGDEVRGDKSLGRVFLEILGDLGRTQLILEDMHNCGLLGAYLPEFGNLTCHMQFDSYHQFTVDQHTLFAMGNLDAVVNGTLPGLPDMPRILAGVKRKDLLGLSLLLHDMGKYMGRGHVARGAIMVEQLANRLGLNTEEEEQVYFLVERHVSLSDASRMRDFNEPSFLKAFVEKMGSQAQLDALYCLTYADAKAVGEGVLTGWQEAILGELYTVVGEQLRQQGAGAKVSRFERLVRELTASGVPEPRANDFLADLPHNYLHQVPPGEVVRHHRVLGEARTEGVGLSWEIKDKYVHLAASVPDRHALFADITATLTGHAFDILDARTWVSGSGMVVYSFRLSSLYPGRLKEDEPWRRLRADLKAVISGNLSAQKLLEKRRSSAGPKPADSGFDDPAIKVEQRTSEDHTIVDIHARDEIGLLSKLCRAISDHGCEIGYACINTMGDVAVDVFYVQRAGRKLTDEDAEGLRGDLIRSLNLNMAPAVPAEKTD